MFFAMSSDTFSLIDGELVLSSVLGGVFKTEAACEAAAVSFIEILQSVDIPSTIVAVTAGCTQLGPL